MPLTLADLNVAYVIKRISGKDEIRVHLANLGFVEGSTVKVVQNLNGNLIVEVKSVRLALDESLAKRILV